MRITADAGNSWHPKIEGQQLEFTVFTPGQPSLLKIWHDEATKTAIHMEADLVCSRQLAQCSDVILATIREVDGRPD